MIRIYKYSEDQRQFLMVDGRNVEVPRFRKKADIHSLCLLHQTDAIAIIDEASASADSSVNANANANANVNANASADYKLECYSAAGEPIFDEAVARCSVAFADLLGVKPFHTQDYTLECMGTSHSAHISVHLGESKSISLDGGPIHSTLCLGELD